MRVNTSLAIGLIALAGLLMGGCVVHTGAAAAVGPPIEYGYQPLLYKGYVVYYNDAGVPYYWLGGARVWVPVGYRTVYVNHWHSHHHAYVRWHKHRGRHYRSRHYRDRDRSHRHGYKPSRRRHKPTLRPTDRRDKPRLHPRDRRDKPRLRPKDRRDRPHLTPKKSGRGSKPSLKPKKGKKKKKKKKDKKKLRPRR